MEPYSEHPTDAAATIDGVVIRFAGDSGDGMQLTGSQFTRATALMGNDLATLPNFPAEIRAPAGTTFGVSSFQIRFGSDTVGTPGDAPDVLVAMNPAALKVHLPDLPAGGTIILNTGAFTERNLTRAGYESDPLSDGTLDDYQAVPIDISQRTLEAVAEQGLSQADALRCKNLWALGLVSWMYGRDPTPTEAWIREKFAAKATIAAANLAALAAGNAYGETAELGAPLPRYRVPAAVRAPGTYRTITGAEALSWGLVTGAHKADLPLFFGSYPITPASSLLHTLAGLPELGVTTFQAEDEIAAICASIGASWTGSLGVTCSSGPGIALKGEAMGLAVATEMPLVVVNCQRAGPSTGMPTKIEQSDLLQAMFGRNGDAPMPVLAPATAGDCFDMAIEAARIATTYMTPVLLLADGYLVNAAEPWAIPDVAARPGFPVRFHTEPEGFHPLQRDPETRARVWAVPGTPGLEHRVGGLERDADSGHISYDADNHQAMTDLRRNRIAAIADDLPPVTPELGEMAGEVAVLGWGSTHGALNEAVRRLRAEGVAASHIHLRHIHPMPTGVGELLAGFDRVVVPELNDGQLVRLIRDRFLVDARGINQVNGQPFRVADLMSAIRHHLEVAA